MKKRLLEVKNQEVIQMSNGTKKAIYFNVDGRYFMGLSIFSLSTFTKKLRGLIN